MPELEGGNDPRGVVKPFSQQGDNNIVFLQVPPANLMWQPQVRSAAIVDRRGAKELHIRRIRCADHALEQNVFGVNGLFEDTVSHVAASSWCSEHLSVWLPTLAELDGLVRP